jgi:hypothetical protein
MGNLIAMNYWNWLVRCMGQGPDNHKIAVQRRCPIRNARTYLEVRKGRVQKGSVLKDRAVRRLPGILTDQRVLVGILVNRKIVTVQIVGASEKKIAEGDRVVESHRDLSKGDLLPLRM